MEITARPYLNAGLAMSSAAMIAFTPLVAGNAGAPPLPTPHVSTSQVHLSALITQADVDALVANLSTVLHSVDSTLTSVAAVPGTTVQGALNTAVALNDSFWSGLIGATNNSALTALLAGLKAASRGGLTSLAATAGSLSDTLTLTTGQVASLLTSVLTGSAGTAAQAVAAVVNNPLALASYTNLLNVPLNLAGLAVNTAITGIDELGDNALSATNTLVHGVTAQINNLLTAVNGVVHSAQILANNNVIDGFLTAAQGIVIAPTSAVVELVNGVSSVLTTFGTTVLDTVAGGAAAIATDWLGNGTAPGALQNVITDIGTNPLAPASYTAAVGALVSAAVDTGYRVVTTAGALAAAPFYATAAGTIAAAKVTGAFINGAAYVAAGLLTMLGTPRFISNLPHDLAGTVITALNLTANAVAAAIHGVGGLISASASAANALAATTIPTPAKVTLAAAPPKAAPAAIVAAPPTAKTTGKASADAGAKTVAAAAPNATTASSTGDTATATATPATDHGATATSTTRGSEAEGSTTPAKTPAAGTSTTAGAPSGTSATPSSVGSTPVSKSTSGNTENPTSGRHATSDSASTGTSASAGSGGAGKHRSPGRSSDTATTGSAATSVASDAGGRHRRGEGSSPTATSAGSQSAHGHSAEHDAK